ncbi:MAG: hypothetical protein IPM27_03330 [Nitrosomonadales bacterium]|nr:hypothetical protein [Nitrosomonadales bacterium]
MVINPSPRLTILLLLSHTVATIFLYVTVMPTITKLAILFLILLSLVHYLRRDVLLRDANSWCEILLEQGEVSIVHRDGSGSHGRIGRQTVVNPYFVILFVGQPGYRPPVARIILPDMIGASAFREMRVRLKFT